MVEQLPTISVVTPNLNGADTLRRCIDSVLQQEYPKLEYIIVDGGSTDDSLAIIENYRNKFTKVIIGSDKTMYDGVAKGFDVASGEVLAWLNSDDTYEPGALLRVGKCFAQHQNWAVIYCDDTIRKQGWRIANRAQKFVQLPELLNGHIIYQASTFFRRNAYETVGGLERYDLRLAGDYQLWVRFAARFKMHYLPGHASAFQIRPNQLSGDWGAYLKEVAEVRQGALQHLPRFFWWRTAAGRIVRKIKSYINVRRLKLHFPLHSEDSDWFPGKEIEPVNITQCRCPVCKQYPGRLLFSLPDADRKIRCVYFCTECKVAFLFPKPSATELTGLMLKQIDKTLSLPAPLRRRSYFFRQPWYPIAGLASHNFTRTNRPKFGNRKIARAPVLIIGNNGAQSENSVLKIDAITAANSRLVVDKSYQTIILDNSLERFSEPLVVMQRLREQLHPDGQIQVITPNINSSWAALQGPIWADWNPPFHMTIFSPTGLRKLARQTGFSIQYLSTRTYLDGLTRSEPWDNSRTVVGAIRLSRLTKDWSGRGDRIVACFTKS